MSTRYEYYSKRGGFTYMVTTDDAHREAGGYRDAWEITREGIHSCGLCPRHLVFAQLLTERQARDRVRSVGQVLPYHR